MKKWRLDFIVWHWVHAAVVLGLLGTVFLRKTFLSWRTNSEILTQKLSAMNLEVTADQAKSLARAIRAPMWEWHIILGYALAALLVWRILLFFTESGKQNYKNFKEDNLHKKIVKAGYLATYGVLIIMAVSGLLIHFDDALGISDKTAEMLKEVHEFLYNFILIFVPLHIIGILIAENRDENGITSDMINGGKK
ncbi:cytochrome b/b6 domain-containing protein [Sulfurovum sp. zt1-1]|uniref:Cytochrome b/b6 domain-containing protein n=1 Tax=Sulfurovum zhangzhouensis TaxID=3019067 RepID=A0ABT7QUT6_9BACT|nr:cytochrome b/b6 domain-containing protein [Sulfurovum zhangzhouensis]MDM5270603.1 cytochrome b/b6 domain-containing protein [Sulfurovum zhangzhouensis]